MKISTLLLILTLVSSVGCRGVNRLLGQEPHGDFPDQHNINPDDFYVTGTTTKDHQSVYMTVQNRTITVEVLRTGETNWITLERPDIYDYLDSYQIFTIPHDGVYFGNWAYHNSSGGVTLTSTPSAPTGTQYRIHTVK